MAARTIVIRIVTDAQASVSGLNQVTAAANRLNSAKQGLTHVQAGLTNSFIKGNLAARAISISFNMLKNSLAFAAVEAINFEFNMAKIATITDTSGEALASLSTSIRSVAAETKLSHNELAQAALEMGKIGLSAAQVEDALPGVAKLSRALDEDLSMSAKAVVAMLNVYQLSASEADRITNQLAFTVKASALDIESFSTAFGYVGGTAKMAGVSIEELQATMDVLSNSGIRASTIGTQLRRIIADLSNENSKASAVLGGKTLKDYESFAAALEDLASKNISLSGLTEVFGRTASSVAAILLENTEKVRGLADETARYNGLNKSAADMNETVKASLQGVSSAWADLGIQISAVTNGPLKESLNLIEAALRGLTEFVARNQSVRAYVESEEGKKGVKKDFPLRWDSVLFNPTTSDVADSPGFKKWMEEQAKRAKYLESFGTKPVVATKTDEEGRSLDELLPKKEKLTALQKQEIKYYEDLYNWLLRIGSFDAMGLRSDIATQPEGPFKEPDFITNLDTMMNDMGGADKGSGGRKNPFLEWSEDITKTNEKMVEFTLEMQTSLAVIGELSAGLNSMGYAFGEQLVESIARGENAFKDFDKMFGEIAKSIVAQITAMIVKFLVFRAALMLLGGGSLGGFNFASGGTGMNLILGALGGNAVTKATGGDNVVNKPTMFMVGESGPERVRVTPRSQMNQPSGESGFSIVIQGDVYGGEKFQEAVALAEKKLSGRYI